MDGNILELIKQNPVEWKALGEVAKTIYSGGTPKTDVAEYWENGTIPWMSSGEVNLETVYKTEKYISEAGLKNSSAKFVPKNSIVIAFEIASTGFCVLRAMKTEVLPKWIFYNISSARFNNYVEEHQSGAAYPAIPDSKVKEFKIPIPPLTEQARIVAILDKFDTLTTSITEGLPREIKLRQQQYEYYHDLLLSFPKAASDKIVIKSNL